MTADILMSQRHLLMLHDGPFKRLEQPKKAPLKRKFSSAPILDPELGTILETDASDHVVSGILSQHHPISDGKPLSHPLDVCRTVVLVDLRRRKVI